MTELTTARDELRSAAIALEVAAGHLNAVAHRVNNGQATAADFTDAIAAHDFARDDYRNQLAQCTGAPAGHTERMLSL